jgi:hypothetical protein
MLVAGGALLISYLVYHLAMMIKVKCSSETSVDFQQITLRYIPEDTVLHNHSFENLKT